MASTNEKVRIGVLALQGSFREHIAMLQKIPGVEAIEVRSKEDLESVAGLIIPGGESTTMALVAERWGLIPELKSFAKTKKPIWGTCAGMIFLAERAQGQKMGGQALLGGLDIEVSRNFFGAQIDSFETKLPIPECLKQYGGEDKFRAVFIRAPAVLDAGPSVSPIVSYHLTEAEAAAHGMASVAVAVRRDHLLATAFHPEVTSDLRWHQMFVDMVRQSGVTPERPQPAAPPGLVGRPVPKPFDMPIYGKEFMQQERIVPTVER